MKLRAQRVASVARWDRPRVSYYWPMPYVMPTLVASVVVAGWSYELWVRL